MFYFEVIVILVDQIEKQKFISALFINKFSTYIKVYRASIIHYIVNI